MSLEIDIKMAYVEQEVVETAAREPEARIRKIEGSMACASPYANIKSHYCLLKFL